MLPNVANVVKQFEQSVILRVVTRTIVDGIVQVVNVDIDILASIQVATPEVLAENLDRSAANLKVHARFAFEIGQYVVYKNDSYKVVKLSNWIDYGYTRCFASRNKGTDV